MKGLYTCLVISGTLLLGHIIGEGVIYLPNKSQVPNHQVTSIREDEYSGPTLGLVLSKPHLGYLVWIWIWIYRDLVLVH